MDLKETKVAAKAALNEFYKIQSDHLPKQRVKSEWTDENKRCFFLGILEAGQEDHILKLYNLLKTDDFQKQQVFSTSAEIYACQGCMTFLDEMFAFYIAPFHKPRRGGCRTTLTESDTEDNDEYCVTAVLSHNLFKKSVLARDGAVCLFCWEPQDFVLEAAHIVSVHEENLPYDDEELYHLKRAGLEQKHQVQNGLLLCPNCHAKFGKLKRYVDEVDNKLVVKVVNQSDDPDSEHYKKWKRAIRDLKLIRNGRAEDWLLVDDRQAVEPNGEMALHFKDNTPTNLPSKKALQFHKTASIIWQMAGGMESDDDYCSEEEDHGVYNPPTYSSKNIRNWIQSNATVTYVEKQ